MEKKIKIASQDEVKTIFGNLDENLKFIEKEFKVKILLRGGYLKISGLTNSVKRATDLVGYILSALRSGQVEIGKSDLYSMVKAFKQEKQTGPVNPKEAPDFSAKGGSVYGRSPGNFTSRPIGPKTKGQFEYSEAIKKYDIVFGIGPAGTGKTYLAMASAVEALKARMVRRIILTRPAIEAGESLGYLPGDMYEKISPYLRPLYDALYDMIEAEIIEKYLETGIIEVAPLAYMRGRTLNDAFIIMDEAQNATAEQMKMFLTRLGFDSKAVITGDITQSDLPNARPIGLLQAQDILNDIEGIKFIYLTGDDVVRHALVQKIIQAYDKIIPDKSQ